VNNDGKLIYVRQPGRGGGAEVSIKIFDPKDDKKEEKNVVVGAGGFALSADGKKLAIRKGEGIIIHETVADGGKPLTVATRGMMTTIDPRTEWKQIFDDAWRFYRDWFYEPTMHGNDWQKIGKHYKDMIDDATTREDVNWIIAEMISELNIGHAYVTGPGDVEDSPNVSVGLLGCDFNLDAAAKAYKIGTIYEGGPWDADARGPLSQPGVDVKEGEYLLAVDGQPLDPNEDPWTAFLGKAGKPTTITINAAPTMDGNQREYLVTPVGNEGDLRYRAWIEMNRAYVAKKSEGKIGYIHVPDTGVNGQNNLFRQFQGQRRMQGLIIDERWNGGGQIPTRFIELLNRPVTNYWARRHAKDEVWPPDAHHGPKAMLINGQAGSGGDAFPYYFKQSKIGKLIGRRTWGGLVGISGMPPFVDGGAVSVPEFAFFKKDGNWGVEGHGVDPDIDVIDDPGKMLHGEDPQLDVAISEVLKEIKERPFVAPKRPASPDRRGMGIPPEQR
jgi:tricorn protease